MNEDVITLGLGHSMMIGHTPNSVGVKTVSDNIFKSSKVLETLESFGFFGSDIDYNTYYPGISPEEFTPKDEEFIEPVFRMLSEGIVSKQYSPVDFSRKGVLKDSMNLLLGQTINCDHETNVGNAIGSVKEVYWQEAYTDTVDGKTLLIPAGINAKLKIDAKANPRIARGIMMSPPSIHSNSVTIRFTWDKSHPELSDSEFWEQFGKIGKDGRLVCKEASRVLGYFESSLVSHGADPYAQKVGKDGKIVNPVYADNRANSFSEKTIRNHYFFSDFKNIKNEEVIHNTMVFNNEFNNGHTDPNHKNKNNMNEELKAFLESLFGEGLLSLEEGKEVNQELVKASIKKLINDKSTLNQSLTDITTERDNLKTEVQTLKGEIEGNKSLVTIGTNHLSEVRSKVTTDYKKLMGEDKVDETMVTLISNADITTLTSLGKTYTTQLDDKFPMKCSDCGSHNVSRSSSVTTSLGEGEGQGKETKIKETFNAMSSLIEKKKKETK